VHLEDFFFGTNDQLLVNADFAEFVFDDGDSLAVLGREDVVEERRFSGAQEARENGYGDSVGRDVGGHLLLTSAMAESVRAQLSPSWRPTIDHIEANV